MPIAVAAAYFLGAKAAFFIGTLSDKIFAPFWPPNTILFCALLLTPLSRWWIYILAAFIAHAIVEMNVGMGAPQMIVAFATNCLVAGVNAVAVQKLLGHANWFGTLRKAGAYILITALASPAICALGGAFVQVLGSGGMENYGLYWARWYASNALGSLTLAPIAMVVLSEFRLPSPLTFTYRHAEAVTVTLALVVVCTVAFEVSGAIATSGYLPTLLYLPLPLILWSAVRFGIKGASGAIFVVGLVLTWRTLNGPSLFVVSDPETNVFALQIFLIGLSAPTLLLGAAIEETRRAEQVTRESEERMAYAAASSSLGLWQYEFATGAFWATEYCRTLFGLPAGARVDLDSLLGRIHASDLQMASTALKNAIKRRSPVEVQFRVANLGNEVRWIGARARPDTDAAGNTVGMSGAFADITAHKIAETETNLQRQEIAHLMRVSMLGELSGGLAHELTQPLTAILSNAQAGKMLLAEGAPNLSEVGNILEDIITEDNRAGEVIHRLRGLLKKGEVKYEAVELNALIVSTLRLLHSELISRRVTVNTELASDLLPARGDPVQLQQILLNLVMNAVDAMDEISPPRRMIAIRTETTEKGEVEVRIADHGTGVPPSDHQHVFRPFFTTKKRGLGLGLSICSSIIKSHGGTLALQNNPDEGATAIFRLPSQKM